jgi:CRP/FNR family cyclic AMP-dependent transcriptional regulator
MTPIRQPLDPDSLKAILAFKFLEPDDRRSLAERCAVLAYEDGEPIIEEGELSPYLFAVLDGAANVSVEKEGKEVYICLIGAGEIVGEAGLFMNIKRTAKVVACGNSTILRLDRESFLSYLSKHPKGGSRVLLVIIYGLLKKLRETNQELAFERKADVSQSDIDDMVARVLLEN